MWLDEHDWDYIFVSYLLGLSYVVTLLVSPYMQADLTLVQDCEMPQVLSLLHEHPESHRLPKRPILKDKGDSIGRGRRKERRKP